MKGILSVFLIMLMLFAGLCRSQEYHFFIPAHFQNPLLKSGNFIAGIYYNNQRSDIQLEEQVTRNTTKNFTFSGILGITNNLTVRGQLDLYPSQYSSKIVAGGSGGTKNNFYLRPQLVVSYRPVKSVEIFGDVFVRNFSIENGPKSTYQDVPVGVDNEGNIILDRRLVTQPGYANTEVESLIYKIGVSINGSLW